LSRKAAAVPGREAAIRRDMVTVENACESLGSPTLGNVSVEEHTVKDVDVVSEPPTKKAKVEEAEQRAPLNVQNPCAEIQTVKEVEVPSKPLSEGAEASGPPLKKAKVESVHVGHRPDPATIRKQVEYYLSDENLRYDKFFHDKISADPERWLDMGLILGCRKMKDMRATADEVRAALEGSAVEFRESPCAVRRPQNKALPSLEVRPQHAKKKIHAHDGGVVLRLSSIPEEQSWMQVKEKLREKLPEKVQIWYASHVSENQECVVTCSPFEGDVAFFETLKLEVGGATLACEVCFGEVLQACLKVMPKNIREKREKEARKRAKDRNRPILIGTQRFMNLGALRGRVKEILNSRSDGEQLKPEGADFKLMKAVLGFHPKEEKGKGCVGIKVDKSPQNENRCFYMVKDDGSVEDFSAKKCLEAIEANPPYVEDEQPRVTTGAKGASQAPSNAGDADAVHDTEPADAKLAQAKPAEAKPVDDTKLAAADTPLEEHKSVEIKPDDSKPQEAAKPTDAP